MSKSMTVATAALLFAGVAQAAGTDSATVSMTATAASTCDLNSALGAPVFTPSFFDFAPKIDATTAVIDTAATVMATIPAMCNDTSTTATVTSLLGGLLNSSIPVVAGGPFYGVNGSSAVLTYGIDGDWEGLAFTATTSAAAKTAAQTLLSATAINGTLTLDITLDASGGLPVLAGAYSDIVTVSVSTGP